MVAAGEVDEDAVGGDNSTTTALLQLPPSEAKSGNRHEE